MHENIFINLNYFLIFLYFTGDQVLSATVYFDNMSYEDAMQILEHAQAYKLKFCLKRKPDISETEPALEFIIPVNIFRMLQLVLCGYHLTFDTSVA